MRNSILALGAALVLLGSTSLASAKSDGEFLSDAIQGNLSEISIGELAQQKGQSEAVKSYGKMLVEDHSAANEKALSLAKAHNLTAPTEPKAESKNLHDQLSALSGEAFDKEFSNAMVEDHKKAIEEFEQESKGSDDVANFAKETIPTLRKHLEHAQSLSEGKATL